MAFRYLASHWTMLQFLIPSINSDQGLKRLKPKVMDPISHKKEPGYGFVLTKEP